MLLDNAILDNTLLDDMFFMLNAIRDPRLMDTSKIHNMGLKSLIPKPHNVYTVRDDKGEITEWRTELVYTPFKKDDISVKVTDNVLSVEIGTENKKEDKDLVYQGISNQFTKFSLRLPETIDVDNISAKADDGILKVTMPVRKVTPKETRQITLD